MCLTEPMVGILAKNDDLDLVERREVESAEIFRALRKDALAGGLFGKQELFQLLHVGAGEFARENVLPAVFEFDACLCHARLHQSLFEPVAALQHFDLVTIRIADEKYFAKGWPL